MLPGRLFLRGSFRGERKATQEIWFIINHLDDSRGARRWCWSPGFFNSVIMGQSILFRLLVVLMSAIVASCESRFDTGFVYLKGEDLVPFENSSPPFPQQFSSPYKNAIFVLPERLPLSAGTFVDSQDFVYSEVNNRYQSLTSEINRIAYLL